MKVKYDNTVRLDNTYYLNLGDNDGIEMSFLRLEQDDAVSLAGDLLYCLPDSVIEKIIAELPARRLSRGAPERVNLFDLLNLPVPPSFPVVKKIKEDL